MQKAFKIILGILVGLFVIIAGLGFLARTRSQAALGKTYAVKVRPVAVPADAATVARGKHIAETRGCNDCHGRDYAGAKVIEDGAMGRLYGSNLTTGKGSKIIGYTDEDWVRAIRHGVGKDGRGLFIMPSVEYSHFSDEDLAAVIAFLKTVPAVDREPVAPAYGPISQILLTLSPEKMIAAATLDHPNVAPPASIAKAPTVEYGRYVAASCMGCHGANFSGGKIEMGPPDWPLAANLTKHADGRLGKWTEQDFINVMRTAKRPDGTALNPVMPAAFGGMDDIELKALWAFFQSLPPVAQGTR
jgi:mono/diheme cytochrome c family protein